MIEFIFILYSLPQRKSVSPKLTPLQRSHSCDALDKPMKAPTPPQSACGHPNAGQELCYLCHQRARRNIPVSFTEERRRREAEEDKLLQQFQYMKDAEETLKDQVWALVTYIVVIWSPPSHVLVPLNIYISMILFIRKFNWLAKFPSTPIMNKRIPDYKKYGFRSLFLPNLSKIMVWNFYYTGIYSRLLKMCFIIYVLYNKSFIFTGRYVG